MLNLGRPTAGPYTSRVVQPLMHLQQHTHTPHSTLALHGCMCTPPPIQKQAMSICVCPLASSRQAGYPLPLPAAFDKAYGAIHLATTARTHNSTASTHARTNVSPCISFWAGAALALFLDRRLSYLLFFTHPTLSFFHLSSYGSPSICYQRPYGSPIIGS